MIFRNAVCNGKKWKEKIHLHWIIYWFCYQRARGQHKKEQLNINCNVALSKTASMYSGWPSSVERWSPQNRKESGKKSFHNFRKVIILRNWLLVEMSSFQNSSVADRKIIFTCNYGVMVKAMDCGIVVSEFVFQLLYQLVTGRNVKFSKQFSSW